MYELTTRTKRAERQYNKFIDDKLKDKLKVLKQDPRGKLGAHRLKGKLKGLWSCWLSANLRMVYEINDQNKSIIIETIGTHKIY